MIAQITGLADGDIIAVNKPLGKTSHDVVAFLRKQTGIKRIGHAGTLDPLATGVLVMLIGRSATKRQSELMALPKQYIAELTFGSVSDTRDAQGPIHSSCSLDKLRTLDRAMIEAIVPDFIGEIAQRPPVHSAIKKNGTPLYKHARAGTLNNEDIPERIVVIDEITLLEYAAMDDQHPPTARIRVDCQKGVYIRSLAHDIGQKGGVGAYMSALTRTAVGDYTIDTAIEIETLMQ